MVWLLNVRKLMRRQETIYKDHRKGKALPNRVWVNGQDDLHHRPEPLPKEWLLWRTKPGT